MSQVNGTGNVQDELNRCMPAAQHAKLGDVLNDLITYMNSLLDLIGVPSYMVSAAALAIKAGGSAVVKSTAAFVAVVKGATVYKAANTDMAALVGTVADGKSALWAFYVDGAGNLTASSKTADANTAAAALALMPATPAGTVRIGYIVVTNASGAPFVGGTTALDATDVTVTYYNEANPVSALGTVTPLANR